MVIVAVLGLAGDRQAARKKACAQGAPRSCAVKAGAVKVRDTVEPSMIGGFLPAVPLSGGGGTSWPGHPRAVGILGFSRYGFLRGVVQGWCQVVQTFKKGIATRGYA